MSPPDDEEPFDEERERAELAKDIAALPKPTQKWRFLSRSQARELALALMRKKGVKAIAKNVRTDRDLKALAFGLRKAMAGKGLALDEAGAEGVAEAILEVCPDMNRAILRPS